MTDGLADVLCSLRCMRLATLTIDGEPYCDDCAEALLERQQALAIAPELRGHLPALTRAIEERDRILRAPRALPRLDQGLNDERLLALRAAWEAAGRPGEPTQAASGIKQPQSQLVRWSPPVEPADELSGLSGQLSLPL